MPNSWILKIANRIIMYSKSMKYENVFSYHNKNKMRKSNDDRIAYILLI